LPSLNHCVTYFMRREPLDGASREARAIYAYLVSLEGDAQDTAPVPFSVPFAPTDPGPGSAASGEAVYAAACASCHGAVSSGAGALVPEAPVLPGDTLASHPAPEYTPDEQRLVFVQKVRHGPFLGYGGAMPPLSPEVLPDAELAALLAYLGL
jgi:thiosulfate dehydrogenase